MAKIMVVDDEADIRESTKMLLESRGYQVVLAKDADECLKNVKTEKPDLILMDILMPGTPVNKALEQLLDYKVIIFSVVTLTEEDVAETSHQIPTKKTHPNVLAYVQKPYEIDHLLKKIKTALKQ
jgi:CheY-like chemotaxis protein